MAERVSVRRALKWLLYFTAALIVFALLSTLALKMVLNRAPQYQAQIKDWVHEQTGFFVRFAEVRPSLRWYGPELYFERLELRSKDDRRTLAYAHGGSIALDVWKLIAGGKLLAGRIRIEGPEFDIVRLGPNRFSVASEIEFGGSADDPREQLQRMPRGKLTVRDAVVTLRNWNPALPELKFRAVDLDVTRKNSLVDFDLNGTMPRELKGSFSLRLGANDLYEQGPLHWQVRILTRDVSLPGWHNLLPEYSNAIASGLARVDFSARFAGAALSKSTLDFTAFHVGVAKAVGGRSVLREVGGVFVLDRVRDSWVLSGRRVRALESGSQNRETEFKAEWRTDAGSIREFGAEFDYLGLDALLPVVAILPQRELRDQINSLGLRGDWFDTELHYARPAAGVPPKWTVRARFSNVAFAPLGKAPGLRGLAGSIYGNERSGGLELRAPGARIDWLSEWPQIIGLDSLQGALFWMRTPDGFLLATQNLIAANHDLKSSIKFGLRTFDDGRSPELTLAGAISDVDAAAAPKYLPRLHISPKGLLWLNRAFIAGHIPHADLVFRGPVRKFPFRDGGGLFLVRFPAERMTLDYHESWPRMENLSLDAEFRNQGLNAVIRHANARELVLDHAEAAFADFKTGELKVHAVAHTDARAAVDYLANTPLDAMAEHAFSKVQAGGPIDAEVNLFFPFKQFDQRRVLVEAKLNGVSLALEGSKAAATELRGDVTVDGPQVPRLRLVGVALGGALQVRARAPRSKTDRSTQLELRGVMTADGLRGAFDVPENIFRAGRADWRGAVRLVPGSSHERWVRATSNLTGLEINLPQPFAKPADRPMPMFVHVEWPRTFATVIRAGLNPVVRGVLEFDSSGDETRFARGTVMFGTETPVLAPASGLKIGGTVNRVDLPAWFSSRGPRSALPSIAGYLDEVKVKVEEIDFEGLAVRDVNVAVEAGDDAWNVEVDGARTIGSFSFPRGSKAWDLKFSSLRLDDAAGSPATANVEPMLSDPRLVPAMHFQADELDWRDRSIGAVEFAISKRDDGVSLDRLKIRSPSFTLQAEGSWHGPQGGHGRFDGLLTSTDVKTTLAQLGYADVILAKAGSMDFNIDWPGPPSSQAIASLNGHVKLSADKGQVVALDPGAGRMLGLASVAALPRRLMMDFSDLTAKGLAFDTIRGDFDLSHGDAYTNNLLLQGPAAEIGLVGRVGLAKHDLDQTAVVTGKFGASLPLASTLAGGPVVGAAVLVFSQVFKQPLKGLARGYYRITGSWDNPTVERVKSDEAAAATRRESKETEGAK